MTRHRHEKFRRPGRLGCVALALVFTAIFCTPAAAVTKRLIIGTGTVAGVYYAAGEAICRLVNRTRAKTGIDCRAEVSPGSIANLQGLRTGRFDMAIVESEWQYHAWKGTGRFARSGADPKLRSVLSLHHEAFTLLVRPDSGIARFTDIKGKRINVGNRGSGHRATVAMLFRALGWQAADFAAMREADLANQSQALCDNRVDAVLFTVGHPNHAVADAIATCQARLVPVEDPRITRVVSETPYLQPTVIRAGLYPGQRTPIVTFGTTATLVTTADLLPETVYDTVRTVFANLKALRRMHPALEQLDPKQMTTEGIIAPLHEGALRYYRERHMLPARSR